MRSAAGSPWSTRPYNLTGISSSPVHEGHRFNFTVTLAGIGTFSNIFGAFGGTGGTGATGTRY